MNIKNKLKSLTAMLLLSGILGCAGNQTAPISNKITTNEYQISLSDNKKAILIEGVLQIGIDFDVNRFLNANIDTVEAILYNSPGGYATESRKLHKMAKTNNLNTYALDYCLGTCITAFAGGRNRYAKFGAKFEFIKLASSGHTSVGAQHSAFLRGQNLSKNLLKKQGVSKEFLQTAYDYDGEPPTLTEQQLRQGNLVHDFVSGSRISKLYTFKN